MRIKSGMTLGAVLVASLICAELGAKTITEKNVEKAQAIIALAVEAHGGEVGLDTIETIYVKHESVGYAVDQSRGTEAPWDENKQPGVVAFDLNNSVFYNYNEFGASCGENILAHIDEHGVGAIATDQPHVVGDFLA